MNEKKFLPSVMSAAQYLANEAAKGATSLVGTKPKQDKEHEMQCETVNKFRLAHPVYAKLLYAVPNGAKLPYTCSKKTGKVISPARIKLVAEGLVPGIPDLTLAVARGGWFGLYIEMKIHPNKPSDEQLGMIALLTQQGYYCVVSFTCDEAIYELDAYLALPPTLLLLELNNNINNQSPHKFYPPTFLTTTTMNALKRLTKEQILTAVMAGQFTLQSYRGYDTGYGSDCVIATYKVDHDEAGDFDKLMMIARNAARVCGTVLDNKSATELILTPSGEIVFVCVYDFSIAITTQIIPRLGRTYISL